MKRLIEDLTLRPELGRALRASFAFVVPLLICHTLGRPADGVFVAIAAQTVALPDLRGAYGMRLMILATMTLVVAGSALLGVWAGAHVVTATLAIGVLALCAGGWRHLSADYGPALSVSSVLLFLLGMTQGGSFSTGLHLARLTALGGAGASILHIAFWPFRPQHPLRSAVAETWVSASGLIEAMRTGETGPPHESRIAEAERELRASLDRTFVILRAAENSSLAALISQLEEMRREVVHLTMRLIAFHAALEPLERAPGFARHLPALDAALNALSDAARSVALTLITHGPGNFAATRGRLERCGNLLGVLGAQLETLAGDVDVAQALLALSRIAQGLPGIAVALDKTVGKDTAHSSFPAALPQLNARSMRLLSAWINFSPRLDPVLVRYSLRMAVLTMPAVALYKLLAIPHGYWIAFTIVVVLQPDYGSTRQKAAERIGGTFAGSLLGSALLWVKLPILALYGCAALMAFGFAYFFKRRYGVAVFFVTLMLVLITETTTTLHVDFTITRMLSNLLGGIVALVSALVFWPVWEGASFPALLAAALRANRTFLEAIIAFAASPDLHELLQARRRAENANRFAAASLQRMLAEPCGTNENPGRAAALTNYNERITREFTAVAVHLQHGLSASVAGTSQACERIGNALEAMARVIEEPDHSAAQADMVATVAGIEPATADGAPDCAGQCDLVRAHLEKSRAEIRAMALAINQSLPGHCQLTGQKTRESPSGT